MNTLRGFLQSASYARETNKLNNFLYLINYAATKDAPGDVLIIKKTTFRHEAGRKNRLVWRKETKGKQVFKEIVGHFN